MKWDVEESRETRWDTSIAMSDDDKPLINSCHGRVIRNQQYLFPILLLLP